MSSSLSLPSAVTSSDEPVEVNDTWQLERIIEQMDTASTIFLDTEATSLDTVAATPLLLQLFWGTRVFVLTLPAFLREDLSALGATLASKLVVGHNLNYDYKLLAHHYGFRFNLVYDTQLAEQLLTAGEAETKSGWLASVSLKSLVLKYLGRDLDKTVRETFITTTVTPSWRPTPTQLQYAAEDVLVLQPILDAQLERLKALGLQRAAALRFGALVPLADVERRGILVDAPAWRSYLATLETEKTSVETDLRTLIATQEYAWRKRQYEKECAIKREWEAMRDTAETIARAVWSEFAAIGDTRPWGKFKVDYMQRWRQEHPNPGTPKLDMSPVNLSSGVQMQRAYASLGLTPDSLDAKHRERLMERMDLTEAQRQLVHCHGRYAQLQTVVSRYGENLLSQLDANQRLHGRFNIGLTDTGRMSSEKPNFQNFPKDERIRKAFLADPGTVMLTADYSGQELAIAAALSRDEVMKADINAGKDLYKELAVQVWGGRVEDVTPEQRQMAKAAVLGINYGQGAKGLVNRYGMPKELAEALIAGLKKRYARLTRWSDHQVEFARAQGYVTTISGARRFFPNAEEMDWKLSTEARNAPIQGSAADVVYRLIWRLDRVRHTGLLLVNVIHDETLCLAPADRPLEFVNLLEQEMLAAFYDLFPFAQFGVKAGVETHVAPYWSKDKSTVAQKAA